MNQVTALGKYPLRWGLAGFLAIASMIWAVWHVASVKYLASASERAEAALGLTQTALAAYLARYEMAPQLLAELEAIKQLAGAPDNLPRRAAINLLLAQKNAALASSDIYIMNLDGITIASSNYEQTDSFIGQNFSYRPYFFEAARGRPNRFFALGTTSGVRGYYFSAPIRDFTGRIAAVIAVKIGVDQVEAAWKSRAYRIFVTDREGIIFMSSEPDILYGGLLPLTKDRLARTRLLRRYADADIYALNQRHDSSGATALLYLPDPQTPEKAAEYVAVATDMPDAGWRVHVLIDAAPARLEARIASLIAALVACIMGFALLVLRQRRAGIAAHLALEAKTKAELEQRVSQRTTDLAQANRHLEQEIKERRTTEAALRAAQANLMRVGKLAALGQVSASLSHEINQPLAAARNYADSAAIFLSRGETAKAQENIGHILSLIDRMSAIGRHLRNAARKPNARLAPVDIATLLNETNIIVSPRLATAEASLVCDIPKNLPPVLAEATRLQQVLVNLITNASDAVEGQADRQITLTARQGQGRVEICLRDRGRGIDPNVIERIFDPFFTTKSSSGGLGLGLSITFNIIRDFGGEITVHPADPGCEFRITLPEAPQ